MSPSISSRAKCCRLRVTNASRWWRAASAAGLMMAAGLATAPLFGQVSVYWDTNGATAGSSGGTTAAGTWDQNTTANWSTNSTGGSATSTWQTATAGSGIALFSAGTNASGSFTVTVSGTVSGVRGLTFEEGTVALTGGTLALGATSTIATGANNASISSVISGAGFGITKTGAGTLTLTGASTYTGVTTISGGTISVSTIGNGGTSGGIGRATNTAANLVLDGGTLQYTGAAASSNRRFTLTANGGTIDASGTGALNLNNGGSLAASGTGNRVLTLTGTNTGLNILGDVIVNPGTGATSVTKTGAGTWVLSAANTYTGTTTITAGTLVATASASALGTGAATVNLNGGTLSLANDTALNFARNTTVSVNSTVTSERATAGAGVTHTLGTLAIAGQTLSITKGTNVTSGTAGITFGAVTISGDATFDTAASTLLTLGALGDGGTARTITKSNTGTLTLGSAATGLVDGTAINITGGTLNSNNATALGSLANVTVSSGATFNLGASQTVGALNGSAGSVTLGANTLTIGNATNNLSGSFAGVVSGTGGLTKAGSGTETLSGANTYTGVTTVSAGTLAVTTLAAGGAASSIGQSTSAAGNLILNGGALQYIGTAAATSNRLFTLGASGGTIDASGTLALVFSNTGSIAASGTGNRVLTLTGTNTASNTLSAIIVNPGTGITSVTKTGTGTWVLSGVSTFTGVTNVADGILTATGSAAALGAGTLTLSGGTLNLANNTALNFGRNTTVTADSHVVSNRTSAGAGVTHTLGTLSIGAQTLFVDTGSFVTSGTAGLTFGATTLTGNAVFDVGTSARLTLGALNDGAVARTITKADAGILTLGNAATSLVNGTAVNITGGTVNSNNATALGSLANVTLSTGATLNLGASQTVGALNGTGGAVTLNANTLTIGNAANNLTGSFDGVISGTGGLTKAGTGTETLSGANTYSGTTTVNAGTLIANNATALGAATGTVTVNSGGTVALSGGTTITKSSTLSLNGTGATGTTGALHGAGASGESSTWLGNISLAGAATISSGSGLLTIGDGTTFTNTLALGANTVTFNTTAAPTVTPVYLPFPSYLLDASNLVVNSKITGTGGLNKTGAGTLTLVAGATGGNTFTGTTSVTGGKLIVDASSTVSGINSTQINIGNSASPGAADSVVLQMGQAASAPSSNNILGTYNVATNASASSMTVYADGLFNMNGGSNGFVNLTLQGGHVSGGNATYNPLLTLTGAVTTNAASRTALMDNGNVAMSANNFTFTVATGTAPGGVDLQIDSVLQNGVGYTGGTAGTSLNKAGTGMMVLTGTNSYSGVTNVSAGILNVRSAGALGQTGATIGDTANGTSVASGAQLQVQGGITVTNETLTINGNGISSDGALRNTGGSNLWNGFVNIAGTGSLITADAGTSLTIANPNGVNAGIINGTAAGKTLSFGGAGDVNINGGIGGNITGVTKSGTGTLTLAGTDGYAGATSVTAGVLKLTNSNALSGSGVTVSNGAAMQIAQDAGNNDISLVGVAATINGTGIGNTGAIRNVNGNNAYAGTVTLGSASSITADSGSSFTLTGGVSTAVAGYTLTAGGSGDTTYSGVISGAGAFVKDGTGTVTLSGSSANTFTGGVTVKDGTLALGKSSGNAIGSGSVTVGDGVGSANSAVLQLSLSNQINDTSRVTILGDGKLDVNGRTETIGSFAGTGTIATGTGTLIAGGDNTSTSFGGVLAGNGVIQKVGTGTLTFNASLNFAGEFNLNGGTLALAGVNFTVGTLRISGNTVLDFGNSAASILTATNVIIENGSTLSIVNWVNLQDFFYATGAFYGLNTTTLVQTQVTPNQTGVAPQNQITFSGFSGSNTQWQGYDHQITPAPEPATYGALMISACLGLMGWRRYRRRGVSRIG